MRVTTKITKNAGSGDADRHRGCSGTVGEGRTLISFSFEAQESELLFEYKG